MNYKSWVKRLMLLIPAGLVLILMFSRPAVAANKDLKGHWAEEIINEWSAKGFISGYNNGEFKPNSPITRAEWVKLVNLSLGYSDVEVSSFNDVKSGDWFAEDISKAQKANYITGYDDGTFKPNKPILREEAAVMLQKILWLPSVNETSFKDSNRMAPWSRGAIGALVKQDIIKGFDGVFKPKSVLTRAEAVSLLHQLNNKEVIVFDQPGTYGPNQSQMKYPKSINLKVSGIVLQNMIVEHNLTVDEKVGEGDITLKNVNVKGNTYINGGGANSIHFENTTMLNVLIDKKTGSVRLVAEGKSLIGELNIQSNALVEAETDSIIKKITLTDLLPAGSTVRLTGSYESVNVLAQSIVVDIPSASIQEMEINLDAKGNQIQLGKETAILKMILNAASSIVGEGGVKTAIVNSTGVKMDKAPGTIELGKDVAKDVKVQVGNSQVPALGNRNDNNSVSTGTSNGGGNHTSEPVITPSPEDKTPPELSEVKEVIVQGDKVSLKSTKDGRVFIVPSTTIQSSQYLSIAVKEGKGRAFNVKSNIEFTLDTNLLSPGDWLTIAMDSKGNLSSPRYFSLISDGKVRLIHTGQDIYNIRVTFLFSEDIFNNLEDLEMLKRYVLKSSDGGVTYSELAEQDTVKVFDNNVWIIIHDLIQGENNVFKIKSGALKGQDGTVLEQELISHVIKARPNLTIEPYVSLGEPYDNMVHILPNQPIKFRSDRSGYSYLIPGNSGGLDLTRFETLVAQGLAKKIFVEEKDINELVFMETNGLEPGSYYLYIVDEENGRIGGTEQSLYLNDGFLKLEKYWTSTNGEIRFLFINDFSIDKTKINTEELKSKITISFDDGVTFNHLSPEDEVTVWGGSFDVTIKSPYSNPYCIIKVEAGAITNIIGKVNAEIITETLKLEK